MTVPVSFAEAQCRSISSRPFQSCIDAFWSLISSIHTTSFPPHASSFYVPSPSEALTPIPGTAPSTHNHWPQSHLHTQWPGSGHPGSPIFSAFYASNVPFLFSTTLSQNLFQNAGTALLDHIGLSILITHSQGGPSGWLLADARPKLVRGIIAIEPAGPPFTNKAIKGVQKPYGIAAIALTYDPPAAEGDTPLQIEIIDETPPGGGEPWKLQTEPARQLVNLADISVVVVTAEASYHAAYDECTVRFLKQAGVMVSWLRLADQGIRGNGHMMFMEKNNLSIAHLLEKHIAKLL